MSSKLVATALLLGLAWLAPGHAQNTGPIRIGVLNDQSGVYADFGGAGSVVAVQMAIEDYGGTALGRKLEVVSADHQNKPDVALSIVREWFDRGNVDAVLDLTTSAVALAVKDVAVAKNKAMLISSASSPDLTGKACSPITVHWGFDSYGLSNVATKATVANGGKTWFFITGDNVGSHAQEEQAAASVIAAGGQVLGHARHPLATSDFSSYLLQAQASKANVIALANAGADTTNAIKQAREFGIAKGGQSIVPMLVYLTDLHAIGLDAAQGLIFADGFYWDRTETSRAWSRRFMARYKGRAPTIVQAGAYSLTLHFLRAMDATKTEAADKIVAAMKATPVNDALWQNVTIREDGRSLNDIYLVQAKTPAESKEEWDLYKIIATVPGAQAFRPLKEGGCPLVKE
jgi:branched-chain amino acid transport system substrate-binding protein